jgi:fructokinase
VVFGEVLWDCFPGHATLGGAPLNFAVHAARLGCCPYLVSAVGEDPLGRDARARIVEAGVPDKFLGTTPHFATGRVSVELDEQGQPEFTIHRPAAYDAVELSPAQLGELSALAPAWLYHGTLSSMVPQPRKVLLQLMEALPHARRFYDVNLRRASYTPELVDDLLARANVVKLNADEMRIIGPLCGLPCGNIPDFCRQGQIRYGWDAVAVTMGARGCGLWMGGQYAELPGSAIEVADTVGAGDAFAAAFVHGLSQGWPLARIGEFANRVGALVASRPGGTPEWSVAEVLRLGSSQ